MPRPYEAVYIFDSTLEDTAITDKLTRFHAMLGAGGTAPADMKVDLWAAASSPTRSAPARPATTSSRVSRSNPRSSPSSSVRSSSMTASSAT